MPVHEGAACSKFTTRRLIKIKIIAVGSFIANITETEYWVCFGHRTSHVPNRQQMSKNDRFGSLALEPAH